MENEKIEEGVKNEKGTGLISGTKMKPDLFSFSAKVSLRF